MRRTTIILLGLLSSLLLLSVIFVFYLWSIKPTVTNIELPVCGSRPDPSQLVTIDTYPCKVLKFIDDKKGFSSKINISLQVGPSTDPDDHKLSLSKESVTKVSGDTLIIQLNYKKEMERLLGKKTRTSQIEFALNYYADSKTPLIICNEAKGLKHITLDEVVLPKLKIISPYGAVDICSSKVSDLDVSGCQKVSLN